IFQKYTPRHTRRNSTHRFGGLRIDCRMRLSRLATRPADAAFPRAADNPTGAAVLGIPIDVDTLVVARGGTGWTHARSGSAAHSRAAHNATGATIVGIRRDVDTLIVARGGAGRTHARSGSAAFARAAHNATGAAIVGIRRDVD